MAKKPVNFYVCIHCGHQENKWLGRCPACGEWNCLEQSTTPSMTGKNKTQLPVSQLQNLASINLEEISRWPTGLSELDRVLGNGIVPSSSVLISGEPGIGKSTLILQAACLCGLNCLYVTGEESAAQIALRAQRLGIKASRLQILEEHNLERILGIVQKNPVQLLIIDSIQTICSEELGPVPGTVNQVKYSSLELSGWARENNSALFLVAHVTKDGSIAGPKVMEHLVDTIVYFEQSETELRILRALKNRYGSVDEVGLFEMRSTGLLPVNDPGQRFLGTPDTDGKIPAGTCVTPVYEGSRVLMVEIQALTVPSKGSFSRVYSDKIDNQRVSRIAAVLEKHTGMSFSDQDIYVNVGGGLRLSEVSIDLGLAMALLSARSGIQLPKGTVFAGELSLAGEIRSIRHLNRRISSSLETGFTAFYGPKPATGDEIISATGFKILKTIKQAVETLVSLGPKAK